MTSTCMIALLSAMVITGCMHRMSDREVRDVTTCEDTSKREIRKNLLLAGYTVADEEEDYLVTDYKQISESLWQRVSFVIDDADDSWRFKFRKRYEYENKIPVASTTVTTTRKSRRSRQTRQTVERSQV